ncbi:MAG: lipoyl synthase [Pseudomonadota bacterium]
MNGRSTDSSRRRLPEWLKKRAVPGEAIHAIKRGLRDSALHTVCEEARCPNLGECFSRGTATMMIMGDTCTRRCGFCAVKGGVPGPLDAGEPSRVALQVKVMKLKHAVVTSVTRDDLPDGGGAHFAQTIAEIRRLCPEITIEVLTPDFCGSEEAIGTVCSAAPDIFNHNIETVERLTPVVRDRRASYRRSLDVLRIAAKTLPFVRGGKGGVDHDLPPLTPPYKGGGLIKSGLMVGLGETCNEVAGALLDLKEAGCDIVTIGQYLRPSKDALPVVSYVEPSTFEKYRENALNIGFKTVFSGPFIRSSYLADKALL